VVFVVPVGQGRERLVVSVDHMEVLMGGTSLTVATALSLLCLALGVRADDRVAITGGMDLRGNICHVQGLAGKLEGCKERGIRRLLVPAASLEHWEVGELATEELRTYAKETLLAYRSVGEALQHVLLGEAQSRMVVALP
jgi:ATP-dependent Lon protease